MAFRTSLLPGLRSDAEPGRETEAPGAVISPHASASPAAPRAAAASAGAGRDAARGAWRGLFCLCSSPLRCQRPRRTAIRRSRNPIRAGKAHAGPGAGQPGVASHGHRAAGELRPWLRAPLFLLPRPPPGLRSVPWASSGHARLRSHPRLCTGTFQLPDQGHVED